MTYNTDVFCLAGQKSQLRSASHILVSFCMSKPSHSDCNQGPGSTECRRAYVVRGESELLLAPSSIAVAAVCQLLLQTLLQAVHLPFFTLCQCLMKVPVGQRAVST